MAGHLDNSRAASAAFHEMLVMRCRVDGAEFPDALRVSVTESINRLIFVSDDSQGAIGRQYVQEVLLGLVKILIFVNNHMVEPLYLWAGRIIPEVPESLWNKFANQHRIVETKPVKRSEER